jgi:hypothetical protein
MNAETIARDMAEAERLWGLARVLTNPLAARPCAHCDALDELDHEDDCPTQRGRIHEPKERR